MKALRGLVIALLAVVLVVAAVFLVANLARRAPKRNPRSRASAPHTDSAPLADASLRDLEERGLLDDVPAQPEVEQPVVSSADDAASHAEPFGVLAADEDSHTADVVSSAFLDELTEALGDTAVDSAPPVSVEQADEQLPPVEELSVAMEIELEVAELAAEPAQPAEDATLAVLDDAGLLDDAAELQPEPPASTEPPHVEAPRSAISVLPDLPAPAEAAPRVTGPNAARAEALLDEGNAYFNVGQYALAIGRYSDAVDLDPGLVAALYNRANARTRLGEYDGALSDYDAALVLNSRDTDALNNRGMLHLHRGDTRSALADLNAALAIDPHDTTVVVNRGLVHLEAGEAQAAFDDFAEAARMDPRDASAHYGAAQASAALGDTAAALSSLRNAIRLEGAYAREAAADPHFALLQANADFARLLRESGR